MAGNSYIVETKNKTVKATNLGMFYVQIPSGIVVNPRGEVVEPKVHNGSRFVLINRKRIAISKLTHLDYKEAMHFKKVFCSSIIQSI